MRTVTVSVTRKLNRMTFLLHFHQVGDVLLVGLREMWKIERSVIAEMPPKHVVDELELYEGHNEFLQLAVSDVETFRNVLLTIVRQASTFL